MDLSNYQLDQCKSCTKRGFSKTGLVCSINNERREYNGECPDFILDPKVEVANERIYGGLRPKLWVGGMTILGGIIWFSIGLIYGIIFYYPLLMIVLGIVIIIRSWQGFDKKKKPKPTDDVLDDHEIL